MLLSHKLRFVALLIASLVIPFAATQSALACACCDTYYVHDVATDDVLNVRSGPGSDFKVVATLRPDERCITRNGEQRGSWVYISANESGNSGWVHERFLKFFDGTN